MSMKIIETRKLYRWTFVFVVLGLLNGALIGFLAADYLHDKTHVPQEALKRAREVVDAEMRAACFNWFTDKRSKDDTPGRIVACRAPQFLSNPLGAVEIK